MDSLLIGLRAQDYHESLRNIGAFGPKEVSFGKTLLIGKAASLAMHLRGLLYVDNIDQLKYAAASLGIGGLELPAVLDELQEVDFLSVVKTGTTIKRVELRIPEFRSGYAELGERWKQLDPSQVETQGVELLEQLYRGPVAERELRRATQLETGEYSILTDVMRSGQLMVTQPVDGEKIAFTPLAVDGNPTPYLQWAKRFPSEVGAAIELLKSSQGLPLADASLKSNQALLDAVATGVVLPVQVAGATGTQEFLFAPRGGLQPHERAILDKSRALVACVRYGQNFAEGRAIRFPKSILQRLRDYKKFKHGHPDLLSQYGLLAEKLIGRPVDEGNGRWNFEIDDTVENIKALDIAIEMLEHGESPSAGIDLEAQRALLTPHGYKPPPSARPKLVKDPEVSKETRADIIREMTKLARGMS